MRSLADTACLLCPHPHWWRRSAWLARPRPRSVSPAGRFQSHHRDGPYKRECFFASFFSSLLPVSYHLVFACWAAIASATLLVWGESHSFCFLCPKEPLMEVINASSEREPAQPPVELSHSAPAPIPPAELDAARQQRAREYARIKHWLTLADLALGAVA